MTKAPARSANSARRRSAAPRPKDAATVRDAARPAPAAGTTPSAILEAALRIFARDGFDGASIPEIARAASIGHPLVHYHFGSKENLWRAAVDYAFGDLGRSLIVLEEASAGLEPVDALRLLCRGFAGFTARHPLHTMILLNEVRSGGDRLDWIVERHLAPQHARLDRVIEAAVAAGQIRPIPAVHLSSIAVGAIAHFFGASPLIARLYDVDVHDADVIEAHISWVLEVLMHGLATAPAGSATGTPSRRQG